MAEKTKFWGVVPTILEISKDPTNFYIGRTVWFSIIFVYFSVVHVVQAAWANLVKHFQCHGDVSSLCLARCYEDHFSRPILGVWYVVGFAFSSIFFVMEFFVSQKLHKRTKLLRKPSADKGSDGGGRADPGKTEDEIFDLSHEKTLLAMYLVYFLVQCSVQVAFLATLVHCQLPLVRRPIRCAAPDCGGPRRCLVLGTQEKVMSIVLLATLSMVIMMFCVMFFLYTVNKYSVMVRHSKGSSGDH